MNASPQTDTPSHRTAPIELWRVAQAFMHILHALFGSPEQVAAKHTLRFEAHRLMASWLRTAEAMMRRLLLIEAAAYSKPNTRPLLHPKRQRVRKLRTFTPEEPEKWRVSFRCFMERRRPAGMRRSRPTRTPALHKRISREDRWCSENWKPARFRSAWPLAERYEALLRVFNDPAPYARRLAARLHATPHRTRELLRAPPEAEARIDKFDTLTRAAETASVKINSS